MSKEFFLFKLNYVDKVNRLCAYIKTILDFVDLEKFIKYWIFEERKLPVRGIELYWFDVDGDQFKVRNREEYDIFKSKNPTNAMLWVSVNEKYKEPETLRFIHSCATCDGCNLTTSYNYDKSGYMRCAVCNYERGHCCLYIVEGVNVPHLIMGQTPHILERTESQKLYDNNNRAIVPSMEKENNKNMQNLVVADDSSEDEEDKKAALLLARLENIFEKDTDDDTASIISTASTIRSTATSKSMSTGAVNKPHSTDKVIKPARTLPAHVVNALQVMTNLGYKNENGWLTQLLLATNGRIKEALDIIQPGKKNLKEQEKN